MRPLRLSLFMLPAVLGLACNRPQPPDPHVMVRRAMRGVLVYPLSTEVAVSAGTDAAQVTLASKDSVGAVARWFRQSLQANGWTLVSDLTSTDGSVAISATHGQRPLWITLHPNVGAPGTTYTVIAAVVDSTAASDTGKPAPRNSASARRSH